MKETGTFIFGAEYDGQEMKEFSLGPLRFKERLALLEADESAEMDDQHFGLLTLSKQLRIPGIPQDKITPEFILDMYGDDVDALFEAQGRLEEKIARFREEAAAGKKDDPGGKETGVSGP